MKVGYLNLTIQCKVIKTGNIKRDLQKLLRYSDCPHYIDMSFS